MGRQKPNKPRNRKPKSMPPEGLLFNPAEAWHAMTSDGSEFHHADLIAVGNSLQMMMYPVRMGWAEVTWRGNLRDPEDGQLEKFAEGLIHQRRAVLGLDDSALLLYIPDTGEEGVGDLAKVEAPEDMDAVDSLDDIDFIWTEPNLHEFFEQMGRAMKSILPTLKGAEPVEGWSAEEFRRCPGCGHILFDTMTTAMGRMGSRGLVEICGRCASGETWRIADAIGMKPTRVQQQIRNAVNQYLAG